MIPLSRFNFSLPPRPLYDFLGAASQRYLFTLGFVAAFFIEAFTRSEKSTPAFRMAVKYTGKIVAQAVAYYFKSSSEFKLYTGYKNLLGIAKNGTRDQALQKADQLLGNFRNQAGSTYYQCLVRVRWCNC